MILGDDFFMNEALKLAKRAAEEGEIPVGALVVTNEGLIIGKGYNAVERTNDVSAHAEMIALTAAFDTLGSKVLRNCRFYVTLEPCPMCAGALYWAQIGELIYAAEDKKRGFMRFGLEMLHPKTKVRHGIMKEEAGELVSGFFKNTVRR